MQKHDSDPMKAGSYRSALLVPLGAALAFSLLIVVAGASLAFDWWLDDARSQRIAQARRTLDVAIGVDRDKLEAALHLLQADPRLKAAWREGDREHLMQVAGPLFEPLRAEHNITHLYFMTPERRMFLRVHHPARYGDLIDRHTALEAERIGQRVAGLELGPLGMFTLRVVAPWYEDGALLGYVEAGMEIDKTLEILRQLTGLQTAVLLDKDFLQREGWETGMRMIGRDPDWERFARYVAMRSADAVSSETLDLHPTLASNDVLQASESRVFRDGRLLFFNDIPMLDVRRRQVGAIVVIDDETSAWKAGLLMIAYALTGGAVLWGLTVLSADRLIKKTFRRLAYTERERDVFRDESERDSLTRLLNHDQFYRRLRHEVQRHRDTKMKVAVIMVDIDHFKPINDRYGHPAGDQVITGVAETLAANLRPENIIARYGGEEFTVVLGGVDEGGAMTVAERLRRAVEDRAFAVDGQRIVVTVSVGLALFPDHAASAEALLAAADQAMYVAKRSGRNRTQCALRP